jgi:hypothetical protein
MTSLLTSISGYFSKTLILGTFLPVVIFIVIGQFLVIPLLPGDLSVIKPLETLGTEWKVVAVSLLSIVLSGLLYNLNTPIIRLYEGYPWRNSLIGRLRTRSYQAKFDDLEARHKGMRTLLRTINKARSEKQEGVVGDVLGKLRIMLTERGLRKFTPKEYLMWSASPAEKQYAELANIQSALQTKWNSIGERLKNDYPRRGVILPTRLGNVIRNFEQYPKREYGIDAVEVWPRLISQLDKDFAIAVDDAKTSFDFMLNSSLLSAILALSILLGGLIYPAQLTDILLISLWLLKILIFVLVSYWLYSRSIPQAASWGAQIKSAFDLYRKKLLEPLGFKREIKSKEEERSLWSNISQQMIYGDHPAGPLVDYVIPEPTPSPATFARGTPAEVELQITKGLKWSHYLGILTVVLCVTNVDEKKQAATDIKITDTLPENFEYEWGSAQVDSQNIAAVFGTNPYQFNNVGNVAHGGQLILTYRAIQRVRRF